MEGLKAYIISSDPSVWVHIENAIQRAGGMVLNDEVHQADPVLLRSEKGGLVLFIDLDQLDQDQEALLESMRHTAEVIAVSATPGHAVKAFELGVKDFLLIPFTTDRFQKALHRCFGRPKAPGRTTLALHPFNDQDLQLKSGKHFLNINSARIELVQSMGNYTKLHLSQGHVLVNETMMRMEELLPTNAFVRVHRSYIICLSSILAVGGNSIEWTGGDLVVGASYKKEAFKKIAGLLNGSQPRTARMGQEIPD